MSGQETSRGASDAGSGAEDPLLRREGWLPGYFTRMGQATRAPGFWRSFNWHRSSGPVSGAAEGGDVETGERLLSREQSRSDSGAMPSSSTAAAAAAVPSDPSAALAALGEIHEAQEARAASGEADAGQAASTSACAGDSPGGSKRRTATGSPRSPAADGDSSPGGPAGALRAFFGQRLTGERGGLKRSASAAAQLVCLICLDALEPEDFESGEAIVLECQCRGELALRHRTCAEKWARVKGDSVCDVCKAPIRNLPAITPRAPASERASEGDGFDLDDRAHTMGPLFLGEQMPGSADIVFDCIRITWIATIVAVLFLNLNLPTALVAGLIVGVGYTLFARAMYRQQLAALQREYLREHPNPNPTAIVVEPRGGSPTAPAAAANADAGAAPAGAAAAQPAAAAEQHALPPVVVAAQT